MCTCDHAGQVNIWVRRTFSNACISNRKASSNTVDFSSLTVWFCLRTPGYGLTVMCPQSSSRGRNTSASYCYCYCYRHYMQTDATTTITTHLRGRLQVMLKNSTTTTAATAVLRLICAWSRTVLDWHSSAG